MKKNKTYCNGIFEITEQPISLPKLASKNDTYGLGAIEKDVEELMGKISDAQYSLSEQEKKYKEQSKKILLSIIEVMDAFDRVFQRIQKKQDKVDRQMKQWINNFRTVRRLLNSVLADQRVSSIEILNKEFDPHWHKIAETVVDLTKYDGSIVEEVLKGYVWGNQILRKSEVIVVHNIKKDFTESHD